MALNFVEIGGIFINLDKVRSVRFSKIGFQQGTEMQTIEIAYLDGGIDKITIKDYLTEELKNTFLGKTEKVEPVERIESVEEDKKDNGKHKGQKRGIKRLWK